LDSFFKFIHQHLIGFWIGLHNLFLFAFYKVITVSSKYHNIWLVLDFVSVYFFVIISLS
jgi:hypothetical protein